MKVDHPHFERCAKGSHTNEAHIIFVFNRPMYPTPTAEQRADYERRQKIVRANGGHMTRPLHEELGKLPPFSRKDVAAIKRLVAKTHKNLRVVDHWNGVGVYSLTVAALDRTRGD